MDNRYDDVFEDVYDLLRTVRRLHFTELKNAKIKVLYDTKKRVNGGHIVLACIVKPNDLVNHFTQLEAATFGEGYDYILILDKTCWENIGVEDRERILRHELRHTFYDIESDNNPYKLVDHDITDFYTEVELNATDPRWAQRVATLTGDIYEQKKDEAKDTKKGKRRRGRSSLLRDVTILTPGQKTPIEEEAEKQAGTVVDAEWTEEDGKANGITNEEGGNEE